MRSAGVPGTASLPRVSDMRRMLVWVLSMHQLYQFHHHQAIRLLSPNVGGEPRGVAGGTPPAHCSAIVTYCAMRVLMSSGSTTEENTSAPTVPSQWCVFRQCSGNAQTNSRHASQTTNAEEDFSHRMAQRRRCWSTRLRGVPTSAWFGPIMMPTSNRVSYDSEHNRVDKG